MTDTARVKVALPYHLRTLAKVDGDIEVDAARPVTARSVVDALEARYPTLRGTIREHGSRERRAYVRYFVCQEDWSHESQDKELPEAVATGKEPFLVIGALAGG